METACEQKSINTGKPSDFCFELIQASHGVKHSEILFIGDNLFTDILFANRAGVDSLLVLTGVTGKDDYEDLIAKVESGNPTYIAENLSLL